MSSSPRVAPAMTDVESKLLKSIGYDDETKRLHVVFNSGAHYSYGDVPRDLFDALATAKSAGGHFLKHIKGAGFDYERHDG